MKKDFKLMIGSVVLGAILICLGTIVPLFMPEKAPILTCCLLLVIWIPMVGFICFNNTITSKYYQLGEINIKKEFKEFIQEFLSALVFIFIGAAIFIFLSGGLDTLKKVTEARYIITSNLYNEKPYLKYIWHVIHFFVFVFLQYENGEGLFERLFKKITKK